MHYADVVPWHVKVGSPSIVPWNPCSFRNMKLSAPFDSWGYFANAHGTALAISPLEQI